MIGETFHKTMIKIDPDFVPSDHVVTRTAGRLLEEVVELCLASGMSAGDIHARVSDALTSEAVKAQLFPSQLPHPINRTDALGEIADVSILTDWLRYLFGMTLYEVASGIDLKLKLLDERARNGELVIADGCVYRKMRWGRK